MGKRLNAWSGTVAIALLFGLSAPALAAQERRFNDDGVTRASDWRGDLCPVYSHIFQGDKASKQPLSSTLVIHNVDPSKPIQVTSVRYYDHSGAQIKEYTDEPLTLGPLHPRTLSSISGKTGAVSVQTSSSSGRQTHAGKPYRAGNHERWDGDARPIVRHAGQGDRDSPMSCDARP
jgi:hypothetical protein